MKRAISNQPWAVAFLALVWVGPIRAQVVVAPGSTVAGRTVAEWTAEWWKWAYASPTNQNPLVDLDGTHAHRGQPAGEIFFVASVSGLQPPPMHRAFSVPENKYLLVPLLPVNGDNIDTVPPLTVSELRDAVAGAILNPKELLLVIDGVPVADDLRAHREVSPVFSLSFSGPDNLKSLQNGHAITGLIDPVVADGYWVMLKPLPPGRHVLRFGGKWPEPITFFPIDITVQLTVVPDYVVPPNSVVAGKTLGEWSADWMKWAYASSTNRNPSLDLDGSYAHSAQPGGEVFFVGSVSDPLRPPVRRSFTIPEGKYLFFPLLSVNAENIDTVPPLTVTELRDLVAGVFENVRELHLTIDGLPGTELTSHRAVSPVFSLDFPTPDNLKSLEYGHTITGLIDPVVADGYWVMLKPLPVGRHVLQLGGAWPEPLTFSPIDITAHITVEPDPASFVLPAQSIVAGKAIADWVVESYKWVYSFSTNATPFVDPDGRWANRGQAGPIFFVAGAPVTELQQAVISRRYTVPANTHLLMPLLTVEAENIDRVPPLTVVELRGLAAGFFGQPPELHLSIDSVEMPDLFSHREFVPTFSLQFSSADNLKSLHYGHAITGLIDPVIVDGYWVMLRPLPVGRHVLNWGGAHRVRGGAEFERTDYIEVVANFTAVARAGDGTLHLSFNGPVGERYVLEASQDLVDWRPIATNTLASVPFEFLDADAAKVDWRFYRAVVLP
jgi:hypothetical protein